MFTKRTAESQKLQETIDTLILNLDTNTSSPEYSNQIDQLSKLYTIQANQATNGVSKETLLIVAGNLLGILVIVGYEHAHVVTSKALTFAGKLK